jgi:lipopolysaccharide/colanic/teichoic acid biosynthesis glycosyltransferase
MGRSRTTFNEMVRLDLKYIREWNLWLDIKILFMTPKVVVNGSGAL